MKNQANRNIQPVDELPTPSLLNVYHCAVIAHKDALTDAISFNDKMAQVLAELQSRMKGRDMGDAAPAEIAREREQRADLTRKLEAARAETKAMKQRAEKAEAKLAKRYQKATHAPAANPMTQVEKAIAPTGPWHGYRSDPDARGPGGMPPYRLRWTGLTTTEPVEYEQKVIRLIRVGRASGRTWSQIADSINAAEFRTRRGNLFNGTNTQLLYGAVLDREAGECAA